MSALYSRSCTKDSAASRAIPSGSSFTEALRLASALVMGTLGSKGSPRATCRCRSVSRIQLGQPDISPGSWPVLGQALCRWEGAWSDSKSDHDIYNLGTDVHRGSATATRGCMTCQVLQAKHNATSKSAALHAPLQATAANLAGAIEMIHTHDDS